MSKNVLDISTLEDEDNRSPRNVGIGLPTNATSYTERTESLATQPLKTQEKGFVNLSRQTDLLLTFRRLMSTIVDVPNR